MKHLKKHWQKRTFIVLLITVLVGWAMIALELTSWAAAINQAGYSHGEEGERKIPAILMLVLPFVKELVLIGVPLLLTLGWIKWARMLSGRGNK